MVFLYSDSQVFLRDSFFVDELIHEQLDVAQVLVRFVVLNVGVEVRTDHIVIILKQLRQNILGVDLVVVSRLHNKRGDSRIVITVSDRGEEVVCWCVLGDRVE